MGLATAAAAAFLLPSSAGARPGDTVFYIKVPADGAVIKDAAHGLDVQLTCPRYHKYAEDYLLTDPTEGYHVVLSRSQAVDANGLLAVAGHVDVRGVDRAEEAGLCRPSSDIRGDALLPTEPGRYWLQAYRECATFLCRGGMDVSDVVAVQVRRTVCSVLRSELRDARTALKHARRALGRRPHSAGLRARVRRLQDRARALRARARVVHGCRGT